MAQETCIRIRLNPFQLTCSNPAGVNWKLSLFDIHKGICFEIGFLVAFWDELPMKLVVGLTALVFTVSCGDTVPCAIGHEKLETGSAALSLTHKGRGAGQHGSQRHSGATDNRIVHTCDREENVSIRTTETSSPDVWNKTVCCCPASTGSVHKAAKRQPQDAANIPQFKFVAILQ